MTTLPPRAVFVTRETEYELLLARHATLGALRFHLESRGQSIEAVETRHHALYDAVRAVSSGLPRAWRQAKVRRADLDRFQFSRGDLIVAVGQDGLIANVAKYLHGQPVVGINPDPATIDGVLARFQPTEAPEALLAIAAGEARVEARSMVEAQFDTGQRLLALNEIFVGHRSHQSALYEIRSGGTVERQSSSGLIVSSGTGATGWARSIMAATGRTLRIDPCSPISAFFVREAWPSKATGTNLVVGTVSASDPLEVTSRMEGGSIFADGIEQDFMRFDWGQRVVLTPANRRLHLVVG